MSKKAAATSVSDFPGFFDFGLDYFQFTKRLSRHCFVSRLRNGPLERKISIESHSFVKEKEKYFRGNGETRGELLKSAKKGGGGRKNARKKMG